MSDVYSFCSRVFRSMEEHDVLDVSRRCSAKKLARMSSWSSSRRKLWWKWGWTSYLRHSISLHDSPKTVISNVLLHADIHQLVINSSVEVYLSLNQTKLSCFVLCLCGRVFVGHELKCYFIVIDSSVVLIFEFSTFSFFLQHEVAEADITLYQRTQNFPSSILSVSKLFRIHMKHFI